VQRKHWYDDNSLKDSSAAPEDAPAWVIASSREEGSSSTGRGNARTIVDEEVADKDVSSKKNKVDAIDRNEGTAEKKGVISSGSESMAEEEVVISGRSGGTAEEKDVISGKSRGTVKTKAEVQAE
jgi:hypothetical protein